MSGDNARCEPVMEARFARAQRRARMKPTPGQVDLAVSRLRNDAKNTNEYADQIAIIGCDTPEYVASVRDRAAAFYRVANWLEEIK